MSALISLGVVLGSTVTAGALGYGLGSRDPSQAVAAELILMVVFGFGGLLLSSIAAVANIWGGWW